MKNSRFNRKNEKFRKSFFLLGLVLALGSAYSALSYNTAKKLVMPDLPTGTLLMDDSETIPIIPRRIEKPKVVQQLQKKQIAQANQDVFIIVDNFDLVQDFTEDPIEEVETIHEDVVEEVFFKSLDRKPIYAGCEGLDSEEERFECFQKSLSAFVVDHYKSPLNSFGQQEKVYINFIIDQNGEVTEVQTARGNQQMRNQLESIIKKLPKFTPGMFNGKYVRTSYVLPVSLNN